ncbi:serine/threonine protein kinase [Fonticula alba]|uniref:Serine/threonine protein kinase n=1 Tax=Fonticula alba TaxID=691883 RepID=A0A058Z5C3_FONAL|nr:serine/threonine protein kinase [Fonticula alba]KCV69138.1 serine/threonine protein kinase [Fonticula alba]|eukprot:XP_009496709.1 serine/threonine protein kinase [Fonticula alba]
MPPGGGGTGRDDSRLLAGIIVPFTIVALIVAYSVVDCVFRNRRRQRREEQAERDMESSLAPAYNTKTGTNLAGPAVATSCPAIYDDGTVLSGEDDITELPARLQPITFASAQDLSQRLRALPALAMTMAATQADAKPEAADSAVPSSPTVAAVAAAAAAGLATDPSGSVVSVPLIHAALSSFVVDVAPSLIASHPLVTGAGPGTAPSTDEETFSGADASATGAVSDAESDTIPCAPSFPDGVSPGVGAPTIHTAVMKTSDSTTEGDLVVTVQPSPPTMHARSRFLREAVALAALNFGPRNSANQYITQLAGVYGGDDIAAPKSFLPPAFLNLPLESPSPPILVERWLGPVTLRHLIDSPLAIAPATALKIATDISVALAYIHKSEFVHRNVMPEHIWITPLSTSRPASKLHPGLAPLPAELFDFAVNANRDAASHMLQFGYLPQEDIDRYGYSSQAEIITGPAPIDGPIHGMPPPANWAVQAVLGSFGQARSVADNNYIPINRVNRRTAPYCSPEVLRNFQRARESMTAAGHHASPASDVLEFSPEMSRKADAYAYAVVLYELVTRRRAWQGITLDEIITHVVNGDRPELPDLAPRGSSSVAPSSASALSPCEPLSPSSGGTAGLDGGPDVFPVSSPGAAFSSLSQSLHNRSDSLVTGSSSSIGLRSASISTSASMGEGHESLPIHASHEIPLIVDTLQLCWDPDVCERTDMKTVLAALTIWP